MYHDLVRNASFWLFLSDIDHDLAESARQQSCPCGGRLHRANYPRKPRGGPDDLPAVCRYRFSFCCQRDACRKRVTPPSVRFLGRRVYLGAVVVLVAAMRQGPSPRRVRELSKHFGANRRTINRWRSFWREHFPLTKFWKVARGRLVPTSEVDVLPRSLLEAFLRSEQDREGWSKLLLFLSPITLTGGLKIEAITRRRCIIDRSEHPPYGSRKINGEINGDIHPARVVSRSPAGDGCPGSPPPFAASPFAASALELKKTSSKASENSGRQQNIGFLRGQ